MNWEAVDWGALERLRAIFLTATPGGPDYWLGERDLESYDETFGQRIRWKWDHVLGELKRRRWTPPEGEVLDWGCGSGVAARAFLEHFGTGTVRGLALFDRSERAMAFAERKVRQMFPSLPVRRGAGPAETILVSHVLTELTSRQEEELVSRLREATCVLWVEPGTPAASRRLMEIRERLRGSFSIVAPCPHQGACGLLAAGNERHWCHQFAPSPPQVFTNGRWARFGRLTGIDLRSLPLSFLVTDRRPLAPLPPGAMRILGVPRLYKAHARVLGCDTEGVRERRLSRRRLPEVFRRWKKRMAGSLYRWRCEGPEVRELEPWV